MSATRFVPWTVAVGLLLCVQSASAGWGWKPFAHDDENSASTPGPEGVPIVRTGLGIGSSGSGPGMITRFNRGTKTLVSKTRSALTPGWMRSGSKKSTASTPWSNWNAESKAPKAKKSTWFGSWFKEKEPAQPATVSDWLSQERPD